MKSQPEGSAKAPGASRKPPGRNGFKYRPQFGLIVRCQDEADQKRVFEDLTAKGYSPKVVCV